jgi:hypothetical protein
VIVSRRWQTLARGAHGGWVVRLQITALVTALLVSIVPAVTSAQTAFGVLNVWLKARESADAPNDQQIALYTKSKALVIGIDAYDGRSWPQLSNGVRDAEEVAKGLAAQGFEVTLKKNLKSSELEDALKYFFHHEGSDPNTRLLLWFAGHGHTLDGEGYIIPADAPSPKDVADFRDKAIPLRRFGEYMREAGAKHVLAIFDSCFSGTVFNVARSLPPPAITLATTQPVREFISSGEAEQQVSDDGTFRKLFLDVLAGKEPDADANHDGYVTGTELGLFLHQKMTNFTNNRQTPRYGKLNAYGYDRGDFVFQVGKPDVPATAAQTMNEAAQAWVAIKDTTDSALVEIFLRHYGDTFYGDVARARLEELKKSQVAVVSPPPPQEIQKSYGPEAPPATAKTRVTGFTYRTPPQEVDPGLRIFRLESDNTWTVTNQPSGQVGKGSQVRARIILDGCKGTVIGPPNQLEFAVFFPDKGCPGMIARWRRGFSGPWNFLGAMQDIR